MSLFDCLNRAMNADEEEIRADRVRGERAQAMWKDRASQYERDGHARNTAEMLAADDVREAFRREAGEKRHVYLSVQSFQRKAQAHVANTAKPDMLKRVEQLDLKTRGMVRLFNGRLGAYLEKHHPDILGRMKHTAEEASIADELHGVSTGNAQARALADSIGATLEDLRLMFNAAGGMISKMDNWGLPHVHDRLTLMRTGKDKWISQIDGRLDWTRIVDPLTKKVMPIDNRTGLPPNEFRRAYLAEAWDNIVFGKEADDPVYGRPEGIATYRKHMDQRHLHFKSGKDWMEYNRDFGTGGLHKSLMAHVHRMSRDIVLMREFGPNPKLGAKYEADLWGAKAKQTGDVNLLNSMASDSSVALRALNVMSGGNVPTNPTEQWIASAMSTTRTLLTAAFLDRAIISSLSDTNSMRMAAKAMGMNSTNIIAKQIGLAQTLPREDMLRAGWVAETMADAGTALARFQQEVAPQQWAERVTQASMRLQGLSFWTDRARAVAYQEFSGFMAAQIGRDFDALEPQLRALFGKWDIRREDWDEFRRPENLFTASNGATFAMPIYFRRATNLSGPAADRLFFKMQGAAEEFLEIAVPTKSVLAQAWVDPAAYNLPPGSVGYEVLKSGTAFKSFTMTFTINQIRQIKAQPTIGGKIMYGLDLAVGATVMGAISLQINEFLMGRDPQDMTDPMFMARAAAKGGGFGIIGDIVATGQASWGGGFGSYLSGPVPQAMQDVWGVGPGNAITALWQLATGEEVDTNFAQEVARFGKRYTPLGQTPVIGPAIDRLFWDQLQLLLDPESVADMQRASKARQNLYGGGEAWLPGSPLPTRAPDLRTAIGG